jgi:glutathione S-transferase
MPATTVIPAAQVQPAARTTPAPALSLEARMAAVEAAMTLHLEEASLANDVNTAHIATEPIDLADIIRGPVAEPPAPVDLYPTRVANLLQRAHQRLATGTWCSGSPADTPGADCLRTAIYREAGADHQLAREAVAALMDTIHRQYGPAADVPAFNDSWGSPRVPLRALQRAADLAGVRGI